MNEAQFHDSHTQTSAPRQHFNLSPRQLEVIKLISDGHSVKDIANLLNISIKTVESHRSIIKAKLNIYTLPGLTKYAIRNGLTQL